MKLSWLVLLFFVLGCSQSSFVLINDVKIPVEIADNSEERSEGLMFKDDLEGGMLFVFEEPGIYSFWMKDTLIPLDIMWIDQGRIVFIQEDVQPCYLDICPSYTSDIESNYVLELNSGDVDRLGIEVGDGVILSY